MPDLETCGDYDVTLFAGCLNGVMPDLETCGDYDLFAGIIGLTLVMPDLETSETMTLCRGSAPRARELTTC